MIHSDQIPKDLIESFLRQNVVLFVGSGFSVQSGLPTWPDLANSACTRLKDSSSWSSEEPTRVLQKYVDESGSRTPLVNLIKTEFENRKATYNDCHRAIVHLPVRFICTTNWDELLEGAIEKELGIKPRVVWKDSQVSALSESGIHLIKCHGSLTEMDSLIVTEDDYTKFITSPPLFIKFVELLLANSVVLFLGYSFSDYDLKLMFTGILSRLGKAKPPAYIFLPNEGQQTAEYLNARGMNPILYEDPKLDKTRLSLKFLSHLTETSAIYAEDKLERVRILIRENRRQLEQISGIGMIRNSANLGALAVPKPVSAMRFFSDESDSSSKACAIDDLEWEGHNIWRTFIENRIQIRQIISLNRHALLQRYSPRQAKARLDNLIAVMGKLDAKQIQVVFQDSPIYVSETFFGQHTMIQLRKASVFERTYTQIRVLRDENLILESMSLFDSYFKSLKELNLSQAVEQKICSQSEVDANPVVCLQRFLIATIEQIIGQITV